MNRDAKTASMRGYALDARCVSDLSIPLFPSKAIVSRLPWRGSDFALPDGITRDQAQDGLN
jgi:hypothetical protein